MLMETVGRMWRSLNGSLFVNAVYLMANTVANQGLGILFWFIAARLYSTSDVGFAATTITSLGFLAGLANLGLGTGLVRFLPEAGDKAKDMINSCVTINGVVGATIAIAFLLGLNIWAPSLSQLRGNLLYILIFVVLGATLSIGQSTDSVLIAHRRSHLVLWKQAFYGLRVPLVFVFALFLGVSGVLGSWALASVLATLAALVIFIPRVQAGYRPFITVKRGAMKGFIRFSLGNHVAGIISTIPSGLMPLLIANVLTVENAAYFYLAFTLSGVLTSVPGAITTALFAEGSQPSADFRRENRKALKLTALLLALGITFFWFFGGFLLSLFGKQYSDAGLTLLRLLAISSIFVTINIFYLTKAMVEKNIRTLIGLTTLTAVLTLGLSYALLPGFGIMAVGIAVIIAQVITSVVVVYLWRRRSTHGI
jgi:O-antigen/teichoic acid export membrane protein